MKWTKIILLL